MCPVVLDGVIGWIGILFVAKKSTRFWLLRTHIQELWWMWLFALRTHHILKPPFHPGNRPVVWFPRSDVVYFS